MSIKNYLTIIVLACLVGGYLVERINTNQNTKLKNLINEQHHNEIAIKDFQYLEQNISQFLVSMDLILGSQETYLIPGASQQIQLLDVQLNNLPNSNTLFINTPIVSFLKDDIEQIKNLLESVENTLLSETQDFDFLLNQFDILSTSLVKKVELFSEKINAEYKQKEFFLEQASAIRKRTKFFSNTGFLILILTLWYWAYKQISIPLHKLSKMAVNVKDTKTFKGIVRGPKEVMLLNNKLKELTDSLLYQAHHDPLTKLLNRREFERQISVFLNESKDITIKNSTLCYIDLDYFKKINDMCGHSAGDTLLIEVANIFLENTRPDDIVARVGGDEFVLLLKNCNIQSAQELSNRLLDKIEAIRYEWGTETFRISASMGLALVNSNYKNVQDLVNTADTACAIAKESGRSQVKFLNIDDGRIEQKREELLYVNKIAKAIEENNFILFHQYITPLNTEVVEKKSYEILSRLIDEHNNLVYPSDFLPLIEKYNMAEKFDRMIIEEVINYFLQHPEEINNIDFLTINLSGQSIDKNSFHEFLINKLKTIDFLAHKLCFEITETAAVFNIEKATKFINDIKQYQVRFALDDFGTGHASFGYLKTLPVDYIKIDGSFVLDMLNDSADMATVKSIAGIGKALHKKMIAESVETKEIADALKKIGIEYAQGYFFHKPSRLYSKPRLASISNL